jgi:cysteine desulfurase
MRAGTENVYGIVGMAKALEIAIEEREARHEKIMELREYFKKRLREELADIQFNGNQEELFLTNVLSTSFPPSEKLELLQFNLDINGISASAGSACSSGIEQDSHVLSAIGHDSSRKTVRFSISHLNNKEEIDYVVEKLKTISPCR